ncbi:transcription antitermination regulator [Cellulomonas cellasea DSM 20118]|uniref:Transcription antitermination regulator n=2 Tax=Cellulomonas cellasea TaxID=43670 RepID=A0A0A0B828_9CELL|nr:GAF and ANTAR domain-containing protein [Cellulomonas cellasea]KGM01949.1 transcription antitermination regulator [Cellulomonas cellasea DSM 20118]GEA86120.1 RNA-binding protein [Cellulomonas cellasea]
MDRLAERAEAIIELQELVLATASVEEFTTAVARAAEHHIADGSHVGITLRRRGHSTGVASSDERAARCDEVEYTAGEGPCLAAIETGERIVVHEITTEQRWPAWREVAEEAGFRSAAALPRKVADDVAIALNLYSEAPAAWDAEALARAETYADELARTLRLLLRSAAQAQVNDDLKAALASRAIIDQAMGVIMAQNRCSADEAFQILRGASQNRNVKLRDVAAALIEGITGIPAVEPAEFAPRSTAPDARRAQPTTSPPR